MRVRVDEARCSGHARCNATAPDVFPLDESGFNASRGSEVEVPGGLEEQAMTGLRNCPERAITVVSEN